MIHAMLRFAIPVLGFLLFPAGTISAAGKHAEDGAHFTLLAEPPGPDGRWRGALLVDLEPGWKTYWLDPGDAGIPPSMDFAASAGTKAVEAHFPAPHRFDDGFSESTVYSAPFAVAIEGTATGNAVPHLDLRLTIGLCREVCIPASLHLTSEPPTDEGSIEAAFAALSKASSRDEGIASMRLSPDGKSLDVTVKPGDLGQNADLFVAAEGWAFDKPSGTSETTDGGVVLRLPVLRQPRKRGGEPVRAEAILVKGEASWRSEVDLPLPGN